MIQPTSCWLPLTATLEGHSPADTALSKTKEIENNNKKKPSWSFTRHVHTRFSRSYSSSSTPCPAHKKVANTGDEVLVGDGLKG